MDFLETFSISRGKLEEKRTINRKGKNVLQALEHLGKLRNPSEMSQHKYLTQSTRESSHCSLEFGDTRQSNDAYLANTYRDLMMKAIPLWIAWLHRKRLTSDREIDSRKLILALRTTSKNKASLNQNSKHFVIYHNRKSPRNIFAGGMMKK